MASILLQIGSADEPSLSAINGSIFLPPNGVGFESSAELDLTTLKLLPGFIDVHIHGAAGVDVNEADVEGLRRIGVFLLSRGVTSWMPTLVAGFG